GGTMMYFHSLQNGIASLPSKDEKLREKLNAEGESLGWAHMHERLQALDQDAAAKIHPHDRQRIQRALEVCLMTGEKFSALKNQNVSHNYSVINIILAPNDRAILHEKIRARFLSMLDMGLVEEVRYFYESGEFDMSMPAMRSLGYRQVWEHFVANSSWDDMCEKGIIATRQFAKRQLTWLRGWPNATWFDSENPDVFQQLIYYLNNHGPTHIDLILHK
ncbi:MAG TPA: tRNA (adenosine(37)-N6)-dimethylallyltransferase MiaA, partial [Gammaproteobacteria bacterium]|nr:tRNA (adenosine(37)-N6)-dimethylallyltransferase MiaA [Gammaproteobacteria bacterium]